MFLRKTIVNTDDRINYAMKRHSSTIITKDKSLSTSQKEIEIHMENRKWYGSSDTQSGSEPLYYW